MTFLFVITPIFLYFSTTVKVVPKRNHVLQCTLLRLYKLHLKCIFFKTLISIWQLSTTEACLQPSRGATERLCIWYSNTLSESHRLVQINYQIRVGALSRLSTTANYSHFIMFDVSSKNNYVVVLFKHCFAIVVKLGPSWDARPISDSSDNKMKSYL